VDIVRIPSVRGVFGIDHTCRPLTGVKCGRLVVQTGGLGSAGKMGLCVRGRRYWVTPLTAQGLGLITLTLHHQILVLSEDSIAFHDFYEKAEGKARCLALIWH